MPQFRRTEPDSQSGVAPPAALGAPASPAKAKRSRRPTIEQLRRKVKAAQKAKNPPKVYSAPPWIIERDEHGWPTRLRWVG